MKKFGINAARHSANCLCSLKTWAAEDEEKCCDCELMYLRRIAAAAEKKSVEVKPQEVKEGNTMQYFIDTEFSEAGPEAPLVPISVGLFAEDDRTYYAQVDHRKALEVNDFVARHMLPKLAHFDLGTRMRSCAPTEGDGNIRRGRCFAADCPWRTRNQVRDEIRAFCDPEKYGKPRFVGYYSDYDWVVFAQFFGRMVDLPKGWPMYCFDIKQYCDMLGNPRLPDQGKGEHHALSDAIWTREAFVFLRNLQLKEGRSYDVFTP